jgi:hypothetical protein
LIFEFLDNNVFKLKKPALGYVWDERLGPLENKAQ